MDSSLARHSRPLNPRPSLVPHLRPQPVFLISHLTVEHHLRPSLFIALLFISLVSLILVAPFRTRPSSVTLNPRLSTLSPPLVIANKVTKTT